MNDLIGPALGTLIGGGGVGLTWLAFFHPALFRKHFSGPLLTTPIVIYIIVAIWAFGHMAGSLEGARITREAISAAGVAIPISLPSVPQFDLIFFGIVCGGLFLGAAFLHYLASISPHDHSEEPPAEDPTGNGEA